MFVKIAHVANRLSKISALVGTWCIIPLGLLSVIDVFLRYVFNAPLKGTLEYSELMLVMIVWLGFAYVSAVNGNIKIEIIVSRLSWRKQTYFDILATLFGLAIIVTISWVAFALARDSWHMREIMDVSKFPVYPFKAVVFVSSIIFCIELLAELGINIVKLTGKADLGKET